MAKPIRAACYCERHQTHFVRFQDDRGNYSWGCPVCVAKLREDTRKARALRRKRYRKDAA